MYVDDRTADRMLGFRGYGAGGEGKKGEDAGGTDADIAAGTKLDPKALAKAARDRADAWKKQQAANRAATKTRAAQFISTANEAALRSLIATLGQQLRDANAYAIDTSNYVVNRLGFLTRDPSAENAAKYTQALIDDDTAKADVLDLSDQLQLATGVLGRLLKAKKDAEDKAAKEGGGKPGEGEGGGKKHVSVRPPKNEVVIEKEPEGAKGGAGTGGEERDGALYYQKVTKDVQAVARDIKLVANALNQLAGEVSALRATVQQVAADAKRGGDTDGLQATLAQVVKVQIEQAKAIAELARGPKGSDMKGLFAGLGNLTMRRASPRAANAVLDSEAAME